MTPVEFLVLDALGYFFIQAVAILSDRGVNTQRNGTGGLEVEYGMRIYSKPSRIIALTKPKSQ